MHGCVFNSVPVPQMWRFVVKFRRRIFPDLFIRFLCLYFPLLYLFNRYSTLVVCTKRNKCICWSGIAYVYAGQLVSV